jgi:hypothetical protein
LLLLLLLVLRGVVFSKSPDCKLSIAVYLVFIGRL